MPPFPKSSGKTLYDKIWDSHLVADQDGESIFYIDLHLIHEVTTPQAFAGLRAAKRSLLVRGVLQPFVGLHDQLEDLLGLHGPSVRRMH